MLLRVRMPQMLMKTEGDRAFVACLSPSLGTIMPAKIRYQDQGMSCLLPAPVVPVMAVVPTTIPVISVMVMPAMPMAGRRRGRIVILDNRPATAIPVYRRRRRGRHPGPSRIIVIMNKQSAQIGSHRDIVPGLGIAWLDCKNHQQEDHGSPDCFRFHVRSPKSSW